MSLTWNFFVVVVSSYINYDLYNYDCIVVYVLLFIRTTVYFFVRRKM